MKTSWRLIVVDAQPYLWAVAVQRFECARALAVHVHRAEVVADGVRRRAYLGAMATTIALITAAYCLTLCAFANAVATQVRAHRRLARALERLAGVFLIGFGIRLVRD